MEGIVLVLALCILGILATCFGVDSRDQPRSKEQEFAEFGAEWDEMLHASRCVAECQSSAAYQPTSLRKAA